MTILVGGDAGLVSVQSILDWLSRLNEAVKTFPSFSRCSYNSILDAQELQRAFAPHLVAWHVGVCWTLMRNLEKSV